MGFSQLEKRDNIMSLSLKEAVKKKEKKTEMLRSLNNEVV